MEGERLQMFGETVPDDRSRDVWKIRLRSSVVVLSTATSRPRHAERRPVAGNIRGGGVMVTTKLAGVNALYR